MHDTFKWTRETINEFLDSFPDADLVQLAERMEQFKSSKSPKKEWEIVAFRERCGIGIYKLREDGRYRNDDFLDMQGFSLNAMLEDKDIIISVRRLSDASLWSVDEKADTEPGYAISTEVITGFCIGANGEMRAQFGDVSVPISLLQKLPQPILTTVDGVGIFEMEHFWCLKHGLPDMLNPYTACEQTPEWFAAEKGYQIFSTKDAMNNWLAENKPLLSLNDVKEIGEHSDQAKALAQLTALVKQKLNQ